MYAKGTAQEKITVPRQRRFDHEVKFEIFNAVHSEENPCNETLNYDYDDCIHEKILQVTIQCYQI